MPRTTLLPLLPDQIERIRAEREGWPSISALADRIGIHHTTLSRLLSGKVSEVSALTARKLKAVIPNFTVPLSMTELVSLDLDETTKPPATEPVADPEDDTAEQITVTLVPTRFEVRANGLPVGVIGQLLPGLAWSIESWLYQHPAALPGHVKADSLPAHAIAVAVAADQVQRSLHPQTGDRTITARLVEPIEPYWAPKPEEPTD